MNIRNLMLTSMIFCTALCTALMVYATPQVSLTKQDQEKIIGWAQIVKSLPPKVQELIKAVISLHKDITTFHVSNLHVNDVCTPQSKKNLFEGMNVLLRYVRRDTNNAMKSRWQIQWQEIEELRAQLDGEEQSAEEVARFTGELWIPFIIGNTELRQLLSGKVVTESDMTTIKRILVLYSFTLECL